MSLKTLNKINSFFVFSTDNIIFILILLLPLSFFFGSLITNFIVLFIFFIFFFKIKKFRQFSFFHSNELKVIIANKTDFKWAVDQRNGIKSECKFYLQPEWSKKDNMLPKIIDFVQLNPDWIISLQTHKFMQIP